MTLPTAADASSFLAPATPELSRSADAWQRRFGVPWERVECAVRAVSDRAVAASRRKFALLNAASPLSEVQPG